MHFNLQEITAFLELGLFAIVVNIPLGMWRASVKKFCWQWFVAVHLCVPIIFILRHQAGLSYKVIPFLVVFSLSGHFIGGKISPKKVLRRLKEGIYAIISNIAS